MQWNMATTTGYFVSSKIGAHYGWGSGGAPYNSCDKWLGFPSDWVRHDTMKNVNAEVKLRIHRVAPLLPNELLQHRTNLEKRGKKKQSSHQFLGCWFFVSNLLTSPIHNIFTGYFFKICIGRVLKTSKVLLIMDDGPGCFVRCLRSGWQQRLTRTLPVVSSQRPWDEEQRIGWHFQTLPLKIWCLSDSFSLFLSPYTVCFGQC